MSVLPLMLKTRRGMFVYVQPADHCMNLRSTLKFSIVIEIDPNETFGSGAFALAYDETILQLDSFSIGKGFLGIVNVSDSGLLRFNAVSTSGVNGFLELGRGQFTGIAMGHSKLSLQIVDNPTDSLGGVLLDATIVNGSIKVGQFNHS
ncbi:MAG: hypothetical protein AAF485_32360 [Chloroflexota bacterium]